MSYLEYLVAVQDFDIVEVGLVREGHTYQDVDQCFSEVSGFLRYHEPIALQYLHCRLRHTIECTANDCHLKRSGSWSDVYELERCLNLVNDVTKD